MSFGFCNLKLAQLKYFHSSYRLYQERCADPIGRWNGLHRGSGNLSQCKPQIIFSICLNNHFLDSSPFSVGNTDNLSHMHMLCSHTLSWKIISSSSVTFDLLGLYCSRSQPALHQGSTRGHSEQNVRREWELSRSLNMNFLMKVLKPEETFGPPPWVQPSSLSFCKPSVKTPSSEGVGPGKGEAT